MQASLASLNLFTDAPVTLPELLPALQVFRMILALCFGLVAYQAHRDLGGSVCRKLVFLALTMCLVSGARLLELSFGITASPPLLAVHSIVDISVVVLAMYGMRRLSQSHSMPRKRTVLLVGLALAALFWGLMDSRTTEPLFDRNLMTVACHAGYLLTASTLLYTLTLRELRTRYREIQVAEGRTRQENEQLREETEEARRLGEERARHYNAFKAENGQLRQRAHALEQILAISAQFNATRNMFELLDQITSAARDVLGFNMVLLRLYSESTQAFEARAFAGVPEEGKAYLSGIQVSMDDYRLMAQARFRISNSYFINHNEEGAAEAIMGAYVTDLGDRSEGEWHEEDALIVPLVSNTGATVGYLSFDDPVDCKIPTMATIRQAEFLALQATTAIESAEIYDRLAKKNSELAQATEMLKSLGEMKNNFVATVSHELRTPLTSITAYTEILRESQGKMPEEVLSEFLKVITHETDKLTTIIDDILDLSRMEGTPSQIDSRHIDLVALVKRFAEGTARQAQDEDIDFKVIVPRDPVSMDADPVLLQQLLEHLLSNALKFTTAGGKIRLCLEGRDTEAVLTVEDSGIGIPEEKMQYIFERFYQVDASSTREHGGQGVGLAICKDIVEYHDGRIWAENIASGGTRFTVVLPYRMRVVRGLDRERTSPAFTDPSDFLDQLIQWIAETCDMEIVSLLTPEAGTEHLTMQAAVGLPESVVQSTEVHKGDGIVGKVWSSGRALLVPDVTADIRFDKPHSDLKYSTNSLLCVPLLDGLEVIGVVNVNNRRDGKPLSQDDLLLLESLAPRISSLLKQYHGHNSHTARFAAINHALRAVASFRRHDHNQLTVLCHEICLATARRLNLPAEEIQHLVIALRCYDVGLCRVSGQLLHKTSPLTDKERVEIQTHVAASLEILSPLQIPSKVRQIILHHHERYDGEGYPDGLEGESIPIGARLVNLTDSLNAMLQQKPYRPALDVDGAIAEIERQSGHQFCPRMTKPFLCELYARIGDLKEVQQRVATALNWSQPASPAEPVEPATVTVPADPHSSS